MNDIDGYFPKLITSIVFNQLGLFIIGLYLYYYNIEMSPIPLLCASIFGILGLIFSLRINNIYSITLMIISIFVICVFPVVEFIF